MIKRNTEGEKTFSTFVNSPPSESLRQCVGYTNDNGVTIVTGYTIVIGVAKEYITVFACSARCPELFSKNMNIKNYIKRGEK